MPSTTPTVYNTLLLDTASDALVLALTEPPLACSNTPPPTTYWHEPHVVINQQQQRQHSALMIPQLQALLQQVGQHPQQLQTLVVTTGPGSFTGVRVAVNVARLLGQWLPTLQLVGLSTLQRWALQAYLHNHLHNNLPTHVTSLALNPTPMPLSTITLLDARQGKVFAGVHHFSDTGQGKTIAEALVALNDLRAWLAQLALPNVGITHGVLSPTLLALEPQLRHLPQLQHTQWNSTEAFTWQQTGLTALKLASVCFQLPTVPWEALVPTYLQSPNISTPKISTPNNRP